MEKFFVDTLLKWNLLANKRTMPWKGECDPYKIWLSEIILQQTRVQQGFSYYNKFINSYPTLNDLAEASDEDVFKLWEGLGYYTRCKNLLFTARYIQKNYQGKFPNTYADILALKGIGPYTAAAISSFAFGLPYAVVDGNVFRVLSRYFDEQIAIDSSDGIKFFSTLAQKLLNTKSPGIYNQAIMDFGATVCKPQIPHCVDCMLRKKCAAFKNGTVNELPVKEKYLVKKDRWLYYFVFSFKEEVLVNQRKGKGIWENLFEFYLVDLFKIVQWDKARLDEWMKEQLGVKKYTVKHISGIFKQQLTHQNLQGQFINISLEEIPESLAHLQLIKKEDLGQLAFPKLINQYLEALQGKASNQLSIF